MHLQNRPDENDPPPSNLFGWKISLIGLAIILILSAVAAYRHYSLGVPVGFDDPLEQEGSRGYYQEKAERERARQDSLKPSRPE